MFVSDIQSWVLRKNQLSASEFQGLMYIAAESDGQGNYYGGQAHLAKTSGMKPRTLQRVIAQLKEKELLHAERRPCPLERGRQNDVLVLHLSNNAWETPVEEDPAVKDYQRKLREAYELIEELTSTPQMPVDNSPEYLPAKMATRYETPSQNQDAKLAGKSTDEVSTRQKVHIYPPNTVDQPANLAGKSETALIGNARATRALKGNLLTDLNQSISQSVNSSTGARDFEPAEPVTDGLTEEFPKNEICGTPTGDFIRQLRAGLHRYRKMDTSSVTNQQLFIAAEEILSRVDVTKVQKPVGFCINGIANELGGLPTVLEAARIKSSRDQKIAASKAPKPTGWCDFHNREYTGTACPVCSNPRLTALQGEHHELQNV